MKAQTDKHHKDVSYEVKDIIWLSDCNIRSIRSSHDLKNKQLRSYCVIKWVETFYRLKLLNIMCIHNVFHTKLLHLYINDSLFSQHSSLLISIITQNNEKHWEVNNILNLRHYCERLQYKVKWHSLNWDNKWYYTDREKFDSSENVLTEFHCKYLNKSQWDKVSALFSELHTSLWVQSLCPQCSNGSIEDRDLENNVWNRQRQRMFFSQNYCVLREKNLTVLRDRYKETLQN